MNIVINLILKSWLPSSFSCNKSSPLFHLLLSSLSSLSYTVLFLTRFANREEATKSQCSRISIKPLSSSVSPHSTTEYLGHQQTGRDGKGSLGYRRARQANGMNCPKQICDGDKGIERLCRTWVMLVGQLRGCECCEGLCAWLEMDTMMWGSVCLIRCTLLVSTLIKKQ